MARIHRWLELPHVHVAQPSDTHFARLRAELDADFGRFPALRWINPCGK